MHDTDPAPEGPSKGGGIGVRARRGSGTPTFLRLSEAWSSREKKTLLIKIQKFEKAWQKFQA